jgi:hypothetical protein
VPGDKRSTRPRFRAWRACRSREAGDHTSVRTTKVIRHLLDTRLGSVSCRERVRQLRHALGVRRHRLRPHHLQAKPEAQAAFRAAPEKRVEAWPEGWGLLVVDAATVRRQPTLTAQWCMAHEVPEMPTGDGQTKMPIYGAMAPLTGRTHDRSGPAWGKGELAQLVAHLLADHPGKGRLEIHDRGEPQKGLPSRPASGRHRGDASSRRSPPTRRS